MSANRAARTAKAADVAPSEVLGDSWPRTLELYAAYLRDERQLRYSTRKGYLDHLASLAAHAPMGPGRLTREEFLVWLDSRDTGNRRASLKVARVFYGWAQRYGVVERSPVPASSSGGRAREVVHAELTQAWAEPLRAHVARMQAAGLAARTIRLHVVYLRRFAADRPDPWAVTGDDLVRWMAEKKWAPETRKSARGILRAFYRDGARPDGLVKSPADELASVRIPRALPRPTAQIALEQALAAATDGDRLMILLAAYAGLRCREIAAVRPAEDVQDGWLYVKGKGGDERRIWLHPLLQTELEEEQARRRSGSAGTGFRWLGETTADGYLFPSQDGADHMTPGAVTRRLSRALPGRWTGHTLRHRFASSAYAATRDLRAVQELLGHASPNTTARYTLVPDSALRAAVVGIT